MQKFETLMKMVSVRQIRNVYRAAALVAVALAVGVIVPQDINAACSMPRLIRTIPVDTDSWEHEMAVMDEALIQLHYDPTLKVEVIVYGARRGFRNEVAVRKRAYEYYIRDARDYKRDRAWVRIGGHRDIAMIEVWLLPPGSCPAPATPTVPTNQVVYQRGKFRYWRP